VRRTVARDLWTNGRQPGPRGVSTALGQAAPAGRRVPVYPARHASQST
jgi:hypothetical protein